ncbi:MAG: hypothetical protein ACRCWR_02330, partial [Saezia sp.]
NEGDKYPNKAEHLEKADLQKIYKQFVSVADNNVTRIEDRVRINGLIATFSDSRSIVATWNIRIG